MTLFLWVPLLLVVRCRHGTALTPPRSWATRAGPSSTIVVGGGPSGLATAMMLAKRGWTNIAVVDKRAAPAAADDEAEWLDFSRNYLIGLGGRGQRSLKELGVWDHVEQYSSIVVGRKDWAPGSTEGVERIYVDRPYKTRVLARDRLTSALYEAARAYPEIRFLWSTEIEDAIVRDDCVHLDDGKTTLSAPFVIAADGAARAIVSKLEEAGTMRVVKYEDDNARVFKCLPLKLPSDWRGDINYSSRSKDGRLNFDALPASRNNDYCGVLLLRQNDPLASAEAGPTNLRRLLDAELPQFSTLVDDDVVASVAARPANSMPRFRYVDRALAVSDKVAVLGDAAHTVKPYFGLGANAAFEDVVALKRALDAHDDGRTALARYSKTRTPEAKALVVISRRLDRPGLLGLFTFIGPLILDGIFHRLAPTIFQTNTIAMLQQQTTFVAVGRRKRADRALQLAIVTPLLAATAVLLRRVVDALPPQVTAISLAFAALAALVSNRLRSRAADNIDAVDLVETTTTGVVRSNEAFLMNQRLRQPDYSPPSSIGPAS